MKNDIQGKKLLILGSNHETISLVKRANELGAYTIVIDNIVNSPAKKYASESHEIDGLDVDRIVSFCKENKVDGVLVGVADRLIVSYQKICEELNIPCYGTKEQCRVLTDKLLFRDLCEKYDIPVIPYYSINADDTSSFDNLPFPVMVKPADSNSGQGMTICNNKNELVTAISEAKTKSKTQRFIVEKYMTGDDIYIDFTFIDEKCWPSVIADRHICRKQGKGSPVMVGAVAPSKYASLFLDNYYKQFSEMFCDLKMNNCVFHIDAFVENNKLYFYDPGFRLQGEAPNNSINKMTGINQLDMLIKYSLTGKNIYSEHQLIACNKWNGFASTIWFLLKEGTIASINGVNDIIKDDSVYAYLFRFEEGDVISEDMICTERQVFARIYISCKTFDELKNKIKYIKSKIKVTDSKGNDMVIDDFNI